MTDYTIIDRRLNPGKKNSGNRQRFLKRAKNQLRESVKEGLLDRSIVDDGDQDVVIPSKGVWEPSFHHNPETGNKKYTLPGNTEFEKGDVIQKSKNSQGNQGSPDGEGEDDFAFSISKDEFQRILFEGLELPDMKKKGIKETISYMNVRTGYVSDGSPNNLDLGQSMRRSLGRRIALKKPKISEIAKLNDELEQLESLASTTFSEQPRIIEIKKRIEELERKKNAVPFLDPIDLRYRNYEKKPIPKHKALMVCVMDVSASMGQEEKDLAKRFYLLLYMFLQCKYDKVDVVYIRHHSRAMECTEEEFFYSRETGGTVVSTGFEKMLEIVNERYDTSEWNIYVSQASDGDNFTSDNDDLAKIIENQILPIVQYFAYIEVSGLNSNRARYYRGAASEYGIWPVYRGIAQMHENIKMTRVSDPKHVYSVFRELFEKEE